MKTQKAGGGMIRGALELAFGIISVFIGYMLRLHAAEDRRLYPDSSSALNTFATIGMLVGAAFIVSGVLTLTKRYGTRTGLLIGGVVIVLVVLWIIFS